MKIFFLTLYFHLLAFPLAILLFAFQWKRKIILKNLSASPFLHLSHPQLFLWRFYKNLSLDFFQLIHGHYLWPIQIRSQDQDKISRLKSHPSLLLAAHFHNWELMGSWLRKNQELDLLSAALPLKGKLFQTFLIRLRHRLNNPVLFENIPKRALAHLSKGKCFGIIWDQNPFSLPSPNISFQNPRALKSHTHSSQTDSTKKYPSAPLFGISIPMNPLPHFLLKNVPASELAIFFAVLLPQGEFRILQILKSSPKPKFASGIDSNFNARSRSISEACSKSQKVARRYHRVLEILIRKYPDFYFGLAHRRFKDSTPY